MTERLPRIAFVLGLAAFAVMALLAASSDTFAGDLWATHQVQSVQSDIFATPLDLTEDLAQSPLVMIVAGVAAIAFLLAGRWDAALTRPRRGFRGSGGLLVPQRPLVQRPAHLRPAVLPRDRSRAAGRTASRAAGRLCLGDRCDRTGARLRGAPLAE